MHTIRVYMGKRWFFKVFNITGIGRGRVLDRRCTATDIEKDEILSVFLDAFCRRPYVYSLGYVSEFAVHYTKLLRKNGQWGGGERGGGILYLNR